MLKDELINLVRDIQIKKCGGQNLELKSAKHGFQRIYEALSAFSNQNGGGIIVFGISEEDNYSVVGVYNPQDLIHKISDQCKQMEPALEVETTDVEIDSKVVVAVEVPGIKQHERPAYYKGAGILKGSFTRVGDANEHMSDIEIYNYQVYKSHIQDDSRLAPAESAKYMNEALISSFILKSKINRPKLQNISDSELKNLLGIEKQNIPTLSSVLCFNNVPQCFYPQLCVTAVVIDGNQMGDSSINGERFIDNKKIEGTIDEMIQQSLSFVSHNMKSALKIIDGKRIDIFEYPLEAIKEVVQNALVHRDYSCNTEGLPVRIEMYKNRIEITNPGGLFGPISVDELGEVRTEVRNKTLVSTLETMGIIENRFSGIPIINRLMKQAGLPPPVFINRRGMFKVVLYNKLNVNESSNNFGGKNIVEYCSEPRSRKEIAQFLGVHQYYAMKTFVEHLITKGILAYTILDKPRSKFQKIYRR